MSTRLSGDSAEVALLPNSSLSEELMLSCMRNLGGRSRLLGLGPPALFLGPYGKFFAD